VTPHVVNVSDTVTDASEEVSESGTMSYAELKAEVRRLESVLAEVRDRLEEVRCERDDWKVAHAESLRQSQRLLTYVEAGAEEPSTSETESFGDWLRRVFPFLGGGR
jgi:hypothetical protein